MHVNATLPGTYIGYVSEPDLVARRHPDGHLDLSGGNPVDDVPDVVRSALAAAANAHGYQPARGIDEFREAVVSWFDRRLGIGGIDPATVMPLIGSKEFLTLLPTFLGIGSGDAVVVPPVSYPSYPVGAILAGAEIVEVPFGELPPADARIRLLWINSPSNPDGRILTVAELRGLVAWARENDVVIASDECYIEYGWSEDPLAEPVSILDPRVCDGDHTGLLAVHSLSKRSNLAGYRIAFAVGDPALVTHLMRLRDYVGLMVPTPVQAAAAAALADDAHVLAQRAVYRERRDRLAEALVAAGFRIDGSDGGLFLWVTRDEPSEDTAMWFAERGISLFAGSNFGPAGDRHVRISLTAVDDVLDRVIERIEARERVIG
jgi:succinyldiaminopimelate transaminase